MKVRYPHEQLEKKWWRNWWSEDFSWPSLAFKPLHHRFAGANGEKSLQDYWRRDPAGSVRTDATLEAAGELVRDPSGRLWHLLHVPHLWRDGTPAKAAWSETQRERLKALITERLLPAKRTSFAFANDPMGPDGRVQLKGAVLLDPPSARHDPSLFLRVCCDLAWLPAWNAQGEKFGAGASFEKALFHGPARFLGATFEDGVSFARAWFLADTTFAGAMPETVKFSHAVFLDPAQFNHCSFSRMRFDGARFAAGAAFFAARFNDSSGFDGATFDGPMSFLSVQVAGVLSFTGVRAHSEVDFSSADFSRAHLAFGNSVFRGTVRFMGAKFPRGCLEHGSAFSGAHFLQSPDFQHSGLRWIAALDRVVLEQGVLLDHVAPAVIERQFLSKTLPQALKVPRGLEEPEKQLERQLLALEGGCRAIRMCAVKAGDSGREALFARLEAAVRAQIDAIPVPPVRDTDGAAVEDE